MAVEALQRAPVQPASPKPAKAVEALVAQTVSETQARLAEAAAGLGLTSAHFWRVPPDYYDQELSWRRDVLGASTTAQLCKSMIMENTRLADVSTEEAAASGRFKFVCVVLQYDGPKLDKHKLTDTVRRLEGEHAVAKKQYSLRMVSGELSAALSGFEHNAVTPLGMATRMPLLLSDRLQHLADGTLWLGGGEPDLKLRVNVEQLMATFRSAWAPLPVAFADVVG